MSLLSDLKIDQLSINDRLQLVDEIWESISQSRSVMPLSSNQQAELENRLRDHEANPEDVVEWNEIKSAALARLRRGES